MDGVKGVYHITCVDSVSQWQVEACVQGISEAFLLPVLEAVLAQFPFVIEGFHSDNGSEYINHKVAKLLDKLRIEQTKARFALKQRQRLGREQKRQRGQEAHGLQPHSPKVRQTHQQVL
ncbi:MAG: transposase family protein [Ideonella sp.]|nr:transposase family protein [Ideonella sp.]